MDDDDGGAGGDIDEKMVWRLKPKWNWLLNIDKVKNSVINLK